MRAIRVHEYGGPEAMQLEELPTPKPGEGQALVRIEAAGVNYIDTYQRSGAYKVSFRCRSGSKGRASSRRWVRRDHGRAGDRVAWTGVPGSYANHTWCRPTGSWRCRRRRPRAGASAMLQGMTAHYLAHSTYPLKSGDACLVHAAAGGVGLLLCQMARSAGARVIGTVSTEEKAKLAREAGAHDVILYSRQDFEAEVKRLTGGKGSRSSTTRWAATRSRRASTAWRRAGTWCCTARRAARWRRSTPRC